MRRICIILINELAKVQASRLSEGVNSKTEQFKTAGEAENMRVLNQKAHAAVGFAGGYR